MKNVQYISCYVGVYVLCLPETRQREIRRTKQSATASESAAPNISSADARADMTVS